MGRNTVLLQLRRVCKASRVPFIRFITIPFHSIPFLFSPFEKLLIAVNTPCFSIRGIIRPFACREASAIAILRCDHEIHQEVDAGARKVSGTV